MIDKTKIAMIGAALGIVLGLLIAAVVWVASNSGSSPQATPPTTTASPMPTSAPTDSAAPSSTSTPTPETAFDVDETYVQTAIDAAVQAATWSGNSTGQQRRTAYRQSGFSGPLARSFTPLWEELFDVPEVFHFENTFDQRTIISAATTATWEGDPDVAGTTGETPHRQFRFGVNIAYEAIWDRKAGSDNFSHEGEAVWYVTVDEATGKAVAVEQPRDSMPELTDAIAATESRF